ncbi:LysM peptidoglycan-binding domain-containing protein [Trinickia terrae]|uniref:LysM peptidoglycan-binding domain-containing protein n=1 Tax=Trinickia terrae TaxID=2571161 RepID=A0A4U1I274_9BURK|nr:LysM peptidoglycan-binding domain-containing protein [Trinickia terrae]TKC87272.1 LysM peptidoglycan-binding domain-containing protein [Trinickia terrae]
MSAIDNLQQAIVTAAGAGPFALDAAFLSAGLNDSSVSVPADYDATLCAAFQVAQASQFVISVTPSNVGPVSGDSFTVTSAIVPFPGATAPLSVPATLVFAVSDASLVVQIASAPSDWTWTDSFAFMNGWPFDQLAPGNVLMVYSTADGVYPWGSPGSGLAVSGGAKLNVSAGVPMPTSAQAVTPLFDGLTVQTGQTLALRGVLDMAEYNASTVLLPAGELSAVLEQGAFTVFYLNVADPQLTLSIPAAPQTDGDTSGQAAALSVSALLSVGSTPADESPYELQVMLSPTSTDGSNQYAIGLNSTGNGQLLTPDTIAALVGGSSGSYFTGVPASLQQFLADVGLLGLSLSGTISPAKIGQVSILIGSTPGTSWTPIPNAPPGLDFTIEAFDLAWSISDPLGGASRQTFQFQTQFTLAPEVFKGPDGEGDGLFTVTFDSALNFYASFDGTASLTDFLNTLSGNLVTLPPSISASVSNVALTVDGSGKSFNFTSEFDLSLSFLTVDSEPILSVSNGTVRIGASTPAGSGSGTESAWQSSIGGQLSVGPFQTLVSLDYDGTASPALWTLSASLGQPLSLNDLIFQFFSDGKSYAFPSFLSPDLTIESFGIVAKIPSGSTGSTSYTVDVAFLWDLKLGGQVITGLDATIGLAYDGSDFSGSVASTWTYPAINLELELDYAFDKDGNQTLTLIWEGFTANYTSEDKQITFSLKGWTLGSLLQALVRTLGDPYFTLGSPWDLLNQISLDGLQLKVSLEDGVTNRLSASYQLSSPLNLGFIVIESLNFLRTTDGKVTLEITGSSPISDQLGDLMKPGGQDVTDMPPVPGRSEDYFKVFLLVLGQRIGITGASTFTSTEDVIEQLSSSSLPNTDSATNPVNPSANQPAGFPYYQQDNNWLIATHMGFMKAGGAWTVDAMLVFDDPSLYGLRLALAGPKAGGLAGLAIDILYKKITDDIGLFQIDFAFPDSIRQMNFGAVAVTLPQLSIEVYTNGDFLIDIGFPYNNDFSRSFSLYAIVAGVPVMGSGGIYFGKLSAATATQVPVTQNGTFDPVLVFGVGLQLGLGYSFSAGPLTASFSLTVFGIVEGVIASWHPYQLTSELSSGTSLTTTGSSTSLQDQYYFKLTGTVGIIGTLIGKVDFAIIQASVNVTVILSVQMTYESYREIPVSASAYVSVRVSIKINLGLFSIRISFSFSMTVTASFTLGKNEQAPWDGSAAAARTLLLGGSRADRAARLTAVEPRPKQVLRAAGAKPTLKLLAAPQFTVLAPEGATSDSQQEGAFVFLMVMDAPTADAGGPGDTSFDQLCASFFPWLIDAMSGTEGDAIDLAGVSAQVVSEAQLEAWIDALADNTNPPLDMASLLSFLASAFQLNIETPDYASSSGDKALFQTGSTVFPVFDGLSLTVPNPAGDGTKQIDFEGYTTVDDAYRAAVADEFAQVEASIEQENNIGKEQPDSLLRDSGSESVESMAALIFVDYFTMMGRQLLQAALNLLSSYAWTLQATDSIAGIVAAVNAVPPNLIDVDDVASPNQNHALTAGVAMTTPALGYTVQSGDTMDSIAGRFSDAASLKANQTPRWQTTVESLIDANWTARIIQPDVEITDSYTTVAGDTFQSIGAALGMNPAQLAQLPAITSSTALLTPAQPMSVAAIAYTTADGDTLASVAARFATTVPALAEASASVQGLFSLQAEDGVLTLANLQAWSVADLWSAIVGTDQVAQTAGMVSRFLMFGLNLPVSSGLTLSEQFLFPAGQSAYGLYQLTGQAFPTAAPAALATFPVTVSAATASHGVNLGFVQFDGAAASSATLDLVSSYDSLCTVLTWAQQGNFQPAPSFTATAAVLLQPKAVATGNYTYWTTSDMAGLHTITDRSGNGAATTSQTLATLWPLPSSVLALTAGRQASLDNLFDSLAEELPLLPQFQPQRGQTSPASSQTDYADLQNWAWATQIAFTIKRLPVSGTTSGGADDVPNGTANAPSLPNVYEITGTSTADAQLLEQLLAAVNTMGESILSGLFVSSQQQTQPPSLSTLGIQEFLTFITQTNLSTETNPDMALRSAALRASGETPPPRGIGNPPAEFIKLLWEQSTVRSGGYYLFYQLISDGSGLSADIFDADGTATLTMIATFAASGTSSFGNALPSFINAFVTTDGIDTSADVVQVVSLATSGRSAALGAQGASLAEAAKLYGAAPGKIAAGNQTLALTAGAVIPIDGLTHQLTQADLTDPGLTLTALAAYYSEGAVTPITAQEIADYNPGVPVALGSVFYIPPVSYRVAAKSAPGDTFAAMASYYGISLDAMSVLALTVAGLLPAGAVLTIDTQSFDLRNQLPAGNVSFSLSRADLGLPPDDSSDPDYPAEVMYSLYNTLSAGVQANAFFKASSMGLPFGPQDSDAAEQAPSAFASHAQARRRRQSRAASAGTGEFDYDQSLGFKRFSTVNPAPATPADGLPPADANPYVGVGTACQIALQWQDVFGNTTVTPFTAPPPGYSGALNGEAIGLLYTDLLIGLSSWSNTTASYLYSGAAGAPVLNVNLALAIAPYASSPDQAANDLTLYQKIYFQLNQNYSGLGVPGLDGNAVSMSLGNSLLDTPGIVLTDSQAGVIRDYVSACVQSLQRIVNGDTSQTVGPKASLAVPVALSDVAAGDIIALDVTLTLTRLATLVDPQVAAGANGLSTQSVILPQPDPDTQSGAQSAFLVFSGAFETAFQGSDWRLRIGEGLKSSDSSADTSTAGTMQLWAVRFGQSQGNGIYFKIDQNKPSYYTAAPIATTLVSRQATIVDYATGNPVTLNFTGVDQNQWFQTCLDAIDSFLSATDSTSAFILDELLGSDPLTSGYLGAVLKAKQSLAESISGTVEPILSTSASDAATYAAAKEKLYQQLLNQIGSAYAASAVVVYGVSDVSGASQPDAAGPPDLYGQPQGSLANSQSANQNFTLSAARIPLGPVEEGGATDDSRLSIFFSTKNADAQAYVPLNLTFAITHLEFNKKTVPGIDGYIESQWLVFVTGPYLYGLNVSQAANIPVVNRNLPTPPTVQNQSAAQSAGAPVEPVDLTRWDYSFTYAYPFAAQDSVQTTIQLNLPSAQSAARAMAAGPDLFTALAQFVTAYPGIAEDFRLYLSRINADTTDLTLIQSAAHAVQSFAEYLGDVATAYAGTTGAKAFAALAAPELIELSFETVLSEAANGDASIDLLSVTINGADAAWNQDNATISAQGITLPAPVVQILPDSYTAVATAPDDGISLLTYRYALKDSSPPEYLTWSEAEAVQQRTVVLPKLDVLLHQNGLSSILVERNKVLFPLDDSGVFTEPAFIFTTPSVSFSGPAVPRLTHDEFALTGEENASLETQLADFFAGLFEGGDGTVSVETAMTGSFVYSLTEAFSVTLPVCLLPPAETTVNPAVTPSFVSVVANTVDEWMAAQKPNTANGARNSFVLTVFGANDQQPLLVVDKLYRSIPAT